MITQNVPNCYNSLGQQNDPKRRIVLLPK